MLSGSSGRPSLWASHSSPALAKEALGTASILRAAAMVAGQRADTNASKNSARSFARVRARSARAPVARGGRYCGSLPARHVPAASATGVGTMPAAYNLRLGATARTPKRKRREWRSLKCARYGRAKVLFSRLRRPSFESAVAAKSRAFGTVGGENTARNARFSPPRGL